MQSVCSHKRKLHIRRKARQASKIRVEEGRTDPRTLKRLIEILRQGTSDDILKLQTDIKSCASDEESMEWLSLFLTNPPDLFVSH
jgi:hypothetical protein